MCYFDDFSSANRGGLRPGDLFLRQRAGTPASPTSTPRSTGPATGLAAGIAAYKKDLAAEHARNEITPRKEARPKTKPIASPAHPSQRGAIAAPDGLDKGTQEDGLSATVNRIKKRQDDQTAKDPAPSLSQGGSKFPARQPGGTAALQTRRARPHGQNPRPTIPDAQTAKAVDGLVTEVTRWAQGLTGIDPQARHDRLAEIWRWPYRGIYQPGTWGKHTIPEVGTHAILDGIATRWPDMVPPHLIEERAGRNGGADHRVAFDAETESPSNRSTTTTTGHAHHGVRHRAHADLNDPLDQAGPGVGGDLDARLNGAAQGNPNGGEPNDRDGDIQVASSRTALEQISRYLLGLPDGSTNGNTASEEDEENWGRGPSITDQILDMNIGHPRFGQELRLRDLLENPPPPTPGFEGEAPDLDAAPGRPADPDAATGDTLIFPDGTSLPADGSPPPSEDQSDILPQGTILNIKDSRGYSYDVDTSGAARDKVRRFRDHINQVPGAVRDTLKAMVDGGRLTTAPGTKERVSNIDVPGGDDPMRTAQSAFDDIVRKSSGDPNAIESTGPYRTRSYTLSDGTRVMVRGSKSGDPTGELHLYRGPDNDMVVDLKVRYQ